MLKLVLKHCPATHPGPHHGLEEKPVRGERPPDFVPGWGALRTLAQLFAQGGGRSGPRS